MPHTRIGRVGLRTAALLLSLLLLFPILSPFSARAESTAPCPSVSAESAVLIEAEGRGIVAGKNAHVPMPMASTTKIMTALVALSLAEADTEISVDASAVGVEGSSVYLTEGEVLTLEQLIWALMLESANDAAVAIAVGLCGSVEQFADEMNRMALEIGLRQTHFCNPHGLDDEEHFTTAYELALITCEALENELLRRIVSTRRATIPHTGSDVTRLLINHNKMLRLYEGCIGVKTGFTKRSGRCLVSAAERDGVTLIAVTLNAPDDWNDHKTLLDHGFSLLESVTLCDDGDFRLPLAVVGGIENYVMLSTREETRITLPRAHGEITYTLQMPRFTYASVAEGEILGRVVWRCDLDGDGYAEVIADVPLSALYGVERRVPRRSLWQWLCDLFGL